MSKSHWDRINDIDEIIQKHGEKGVRVLLLFKLLKTEVNNKLAKTSSRGISENLISRVCVQKAIELADLQKEMPSEEDIEELIEELKEQS